MRFAKRFSDETPLAAALLFVRFFGACLSRRRAPARRRLLSYNALPDNRVPLKTLVIQSAHYINVLAEIFKDFNRIDGRVIKRYQFYFQVGIKLLNFRPRVKQKLGGRHNRRADSNGLPLVLIVYIFRLFDCPMFLHRFYYSHYYKLSHIL